MIQRIDTKQISGPDTRAAFQGSGFKLIMRIINSLNAIIDICTKMESDSAQNSVDVSSQLSSIYLQLAQLTLRVAALDKEPLPAISDVVKSSTVVGLDVGSMRVQAGKVNDLTDTVNKILEALRADGVIKP